MLDQSTERVSQIMNFPTSKQYRIIYLDPPWTYRDKAHAGQRGAEYQYPCMSEADLMDLPIDQISAEDAVMFCWTTWPKLPDALELINWWGFEYKTIGFNWIKRTKHGKLHWGMGNWSRSNSEPCLLATKGKPKRAGKGVHSIITAPLANVLESSIGKHSAKPPEVRDRIVELCGDLPRIELFARERVLGWDSWGNEVEDPFE